MLTELTRNTFFPWMCTVRGSGRGDAEMSSLEHALRNAPAAGCVNNLRAEIGGKIIQGSVQERKQARKTYDSAVSAGHGAYLLEVRHASLCRYGSKTRCAHS